MKEVAIIAAATQPDHVHMLVHQKSMEKAKDKLRALTRRNQAKNIRQVMAEVKRYMQGWLNNHAIATMNNILPEWNDWLRRRIRMYIWKQWKKP